MALDGQEILYFMSVGVAPTPTPDQSFEVRRLPVPVPFTHPAKGTSRPRLSQSLPRHRTTAPAMSPVPGHPHRPRSPRPRPALRAHRHPRPRRQPRQHAQHKHRTRRPPRRPPRNPRVPPDHIQIQRRLFRVHLRPDALQSLFTRGWCPSRTIAAPAGSPSHTLDHPVAPRFFLLGRSS